MSKIGQFFKGLDYRWHLCFAATLRLLFLFYGMYHDNVSAVAYTDVDYKVFTDASRHIVEGRSPYLRHTYRYTPLIAILLIPNIWYEPFGKLLFCAVDLIVGILIRLLIRSNVKEYQHYCAKIGAKLKSEEQEEEKKKQAMEKPTLRKRLVGKLRKQEKACRKREKVKPEDETLANFGMIFWLYNPLAATVATRGNCDSIAVFLILSCLYFIQCKRKPFVAGLFLGLAIHTRLYPIVYCLSIFMYLSEYSYYSVGRHAVETLTSKRLDNDKTVGKVDNGKSSRTIFEWKYISYLWPNCLQLKLMLGCCVSFSAVFLFFYVLYGVKFLQEAYLYHLGRKDIRHNFSLYFYIQYLTAGIKNVGLWQRVLVTLPQFVLLCVLSVRYGLNKLSLNFSILTQTIVMVAYNTVITSQYFVWVMGLLPLCLWQINISPRLSLFLSTTWFAAQAAWLVPAYFLEFLGHNSFLFVWVQCVSFFCANIAILGRLVMNFMSLVKL